MAQTDEDNPRRDDDSRRSAELWDIQVKGVNYLLVAHAAGLVTVLTLLKDYPFKDQPLLQGTRFAWIIVPFGLGLIFAIIAFASLIARKMYELQTSDTSAALQYNWIAVGASALSCIILLLAIISAMMGAIEMPAGREFLRPMLSPSY